jgi:hypothetical protein
VAQVRLRFEILLIILDDLDVQRQLIQAGRRKTLSLKQLQILLDSVDRTNIIWKNSKRPFKRHCEVRQG